MSSSSRYVPVGPDALPASQSSSPTFAPQPSSSGMILSPTSAALIATFLSLFTLAVLFVAIRWIRRRWTTPKVSNERPLEKERGQDIEALAASGPIIPVKPTQNVRWVPQIRSISGPAPEEDRDKKFAGPPPKRARSPPPSNVSKPRNPFLDPHPQSAPAHAISFSQDDMSHQSKGSRGDMSPPVTPHALAVSGMETRSLGRPGLGSS